MDDEIVRLQRRNQLLKELVVHLVCEISELKAEIEAGNPTAHGYVNQDQGFHFVKIDSQGNIEEIGDTE